MVFLIVWLVVLTVALGFLALMFIGARARDAREKAALVHDVSVEFDAVGKRINLLSERLDNYLDGMKNLLTKVKTLEENPSGNPEIVVEVLQKFANTETRIANLQETQNNLRKDIDLLFKADKEYPVLTTVPLAEPVATKASKGGRPKKEGS